MTKELIKTEIDKVQDKYLGILYRIVQSFKSSSEEDNPETTEALENSHTREVLKWKHFVQETYGCLADDPIERGDQGKYEIRVEIE